MVKICKTCSKEYSDSHKFCNDCGKRLVEKEENTKKIHHSKGINKIVVFGVLGVILLLTAIVIFAIPFSYTATEQYTEKEPYNDKAYYTEKEPYQDVEYYQDTEQYSDKECNNVDITKNVKYGPSQSSCIDTDCTSYSQECTQKNWLGNCIQYQSVCQSTKCTRYRVYCSLIIKNLDNAGGSFSFDGYFVTKDNQEHFVKSFSEYLQPGDENTFSWTYDVDPNNINSCWYKNLITPKKTECENVLKSRTVQKSRPVTIYKDSEKSRDITKYRDVQKTRSVTKYATLFQQWSGKVQWYYKV